MTELQQLSHDQSTKAAAAIQDATINARQVLVNTTQLGWVQMGPWKKRTKQHVLLNQMNLAWITRWTRGRSVDLCTIYVLMDSFGCFQGLWCKHRFSACCQGSKHSLFTWFVLLKIAETNQCKEICMEMMAVKLVMMLQINFYTLQVLVIPGDAAVY